MARVFYQLAHRPKVINLLTRGFVLLLLPESIRSTPFKNSNTLILYTSKKIFTSINYKKAQKLLTLQVKRGENYAKQSAEQ